MAEPDTPFYLIDEASLLRNMRIIARVREESGAKCVLALKCFSTWCVFDIMRPYMDGTTSSSPYEARLGREKFGKEVHAYSVGFSDADIEDVLPLADKLIFNSASQLRRFHARAAGIDLGIRVNPGFSHSHYDLADPARRYSRLGVARKEELQEVLPLVRGLMFHYNCENADAAGFAASLARIGEAYRRELDAVEWVSLGGGLYFTKEGYLLEPFCAALKAFAASHGVQVYLEPGESAITQCAELVTSVLDVVRNEMEIAIVDASVEAHTLDHLVYRTSPRLSWPPPGPRTVMLAGRSCLAGDVFGVYGLAAPLSVGDRVRIADAAGYTMVKMNWFNGLAMPSIAVRRLDGSVELVRRFTYEDFRDGLS